jgi:hypothetical protein
MQGGWKLQPPPFYSETAMALWSALATGEQVLTRAYYSYVEPIQFAWRKRRRVARFAIASLDELASGAIDLAPCSRHCIPLCAEIVEAHRVYLSKYLFWEWRAVSRRWHGVPLVIDLDLYPDFQSYVAHLRRGQAGGPAGLRLQADRPRSPPVRAVRNRHLSIDTSLWFRSGGPVLEAFLRQGRFKKS